MPVWGMVHHVCTRCSTSWQTAKLFSVDNFPFSRVHWEVWLMVFIFKAYKITILRIFILFCLSCLVAFTSCQREVDFEDFRNESGDSIYVSRTEVYDSIPGLLRKLTSTSFYYVERMRLTKIVDTSPDMYGDVIEVHERSYLGNDSLPYMVVNYNYTNNSIPLKDTTYLFYNANKKIVKDSVIFWSPGGRSIGVDVFSQTSPTTGYVSVLGYDETGVLIGDYIYAKCRRTIINNNLIENFDSIYNAGGSGFDLIQNESNVYDNKINPYKRISLPYLFYSEYDWNRYLPDSRNNKTRSDYEGWTAGSGTFSYRTEYNYTYNSLQLPVVMDEIDPVYGLQFRTFFYYRSN